MSLSGSSASVLGTLGIAVVFVTVPFLWRDVGSVYVQLISKDILTKFIDLINDSWNFIYRIRLVVYVLVFNYQSTIALYFLAQLQAGVDPYRILWQAVGAGTLSIPLIDGDGADLDDGVEGTFDDDGEVTAPYPSRKVQRRRRRLVAAVIVLTLIFITDEGSESAQRGTVILTIWILSLAGVRRAFAYADERRPGYFISQDIAEDVHIPVRLWVTLSILFTGAAVVIVARGLVGY